MEQSCTRYHRCQFMAKFEFHPELFAYRTEIMTILANAGFDWFVDYASIDLDHEAFGFEICGVPDETDALRMMRALMGALPGWVAG